MVSPNGPPGLHTTSWSPLMNGEAQRLFEKWQGWLRTELMEQVEGLLWDKLLFDSFRASIGPFVDQTQGGDVADWIARGHIANAFLAVRRFADHSSSGVTMRRLLDDLKKHHEFLTRDNLFGYGGSPERAYPILSGNDPSGGIPLAVIEQDRDALDEQVGVIKSFADKNIAHVDANAHRYPTPSYGDLDRAIDFVHTIFRKYALLIAGYNCQLDETRPEGISPNQRDIVPEPDHDYSLDFARLWPGDGRGTDPGI